MRRREFITLVCSAATWPFAARAQQATKTYHIALVHPSLSVADMSETSKGNPSYTVLFKELRRLGYTEGGNLVVTRYSGEGREERYPELCDEVVSTNPDIIVTNTSRLRFRFQTSDRHNPSRCRHGRPSSFWHCEEYRATGRKHHRVSVEAGPDIWGKRLQVLRKAVPTASKVGFLGSRQIWDIPQVNALRKAARQLGISLLGPPMESPLQDEEYRRVLGAMTQEHVDGVIIGDQGGTLSQPAAYC